ncbi:HNH endonuclease [Vibrio antiquarius]|uniref:HNH endonuclease n=1 Tax=Vibrio parahaemolyticus TaxID=670 RepID=UPI00226A3755|nr:HNH endonuclease signature motif containing protein [Vibrio parahaemolyticus]EJG0655455.1 HNH endonuclease [Vibrio parahaemolyticus]EJG0772441.1 HNH endonuclease [Vibrio parahaemolyticus]EJG0805326.1 HNH endonuclease [Vibrio parahaemolyticus]EJG0957211.1 HNH endonuclease [Vibrio parahaemolyticus]EJG1009417.1 HNH endonuclease [Vibrio parahaemolyticus]
MFKTVTNLAEIKECQSLFEKVLKNRLPNKGRFNIGFPGGSWKDKEIHYNDDLWFLHYEIGSEEKSPRYWNGFGLSESLSDKKSNNIVVEINIPTNRVNRKVAGFFAKSENGKVALFHRGGLGGGRKGVGKQAFLKWSSYELTEVKTDEVVDKAIMVGFVEDGSFPTNLYEFLQIIASFKEAATSGELTEATFLTDDELLNRILSENPKRKAPKRAKTESTTYERSEYVKEFALRRADGHCDLCNQKGPFKSKMDRWFLEVHHIKWLSKGGLDTVDNVVALCPNCHRKMHLVAFPEDIRKLKLAVESK